MLFCTHGLRRGPAFFRRFAAASRAGWQALATVSRPYEAGFYACAAGPIRTQHSTRRAVRVHVLGGYLRVQVWTPTVILPQLPPPPNLEEHVASLPGVFLR